MSECADKMSSPLPLIVTPTLLTVLENGAPATNATDECQRFEIEHDPEKRFNVSKNCSVRALAEASVLPFASNRAVESDYSPRPYFFSRPIWPIGSVSRPFPNDSSPRRVTV